MLSGIIVESVASISAACGNDTMGLTNNILCGGHAFFLFCIWSDVCML